MKKINLETLLSQLGAQSLSEIVNTFTPYQKQNLIKQLKGIDPEVLKTQRDLLAEPFVTAPVIKPFRRLKTIDAKDAQFGEKALAEGKVGAILVAGGHGSRLGFKGPKGCFPITPVKHKSLFQMFAEKTHAASQKAGYLLQLAIMTSPENDTATRSHFIAHHFFGCDPAQISFFKQGTLPLLDASGSLFLNEKHQIAMGPDGNGSSIQAFFQSGIAEMWAEKGIEYITFNLVDNALADPFDADFIGAHAKAAVDITMKCIERTHLNQKLGLLVEVKERPQIVEYFEVPKKDWEARDEQGDFVYKTGNISLFCFSFSFLERTLNFPLPLHKAFKEGVWKFEKFIFDLLPFAATSQAIIYPKEKCFAPLKNREGSDSKEEVQASLILENRRVLEKITGHPIPSQCLEIDSAFYYPTDQLISKWKGRQVPDKPYVES